MGAIDIAIESVCLLKYSSSIGLGCDASILAVLHVRIGVAQGGGPGLAVAEEKKWKSKFLSMKVLIS